MLHNGRVVCLDGSETIAQAVAIRDGKIVAIGKEREILNSIQGSASARFGGGYRVSWVDRCAQPFARLCSWQNLNLVGTGSWLEVVQIVSEKGDERLGWIRGRGWDQNDWEVSKFLIVKCWMIAFHTPLSSWSELMVMRSSRIKLHCWPRTWR